MTEDALLAAIRDAPNESAPRLVYADWLLDRGDVRGEQLHLEQRALTGELGAGELERLLRLSAEHGFSRLPEDACARILRFTGGGAFPTQYFAEHAGHRSYLRWRYAFSIEVDDEAVLECDLDTLTTNEWTFRETTVMLAIVSEAILTGASLEALAFPDSAGFRAHPCFRVGRAPLYGLPDGFGRETWTLELRDLDRWYSLWDQRLRLLGQPTPAHGHASPCACGVARFSCGVEGCADWSGAG